MKNSQQGFAIPVIIAVVALLVIGGIVYFYPNNKIVEAPVTPTPDETIFCTMDAFECPDGSWVGRSGPNCEFVCPGNPATELMDLPLYIQDKSYVATSSCSVTKKVIYKVPKTTAVADASLKIIFNDELSWYGKYKSVSIVNGVAKVVVEEDTEGLASCQSSHLFAVLNDTLKQYNTIESIELIRPDGSVIQF